jgi:hypothetical protein
MWSRPKFWAATFLVVTAFLFGAAGAARADFVVTFQDVDSAGTVLYSTTASASEGSGISSGTLFRTVGQFRVKYSLTEDTQLPGANPQLHADLHIGTGTNPAVADHYLRIFISEGGPRGGFAIGSAGATGSFLHSFLGSISLTGTTPHNTYHVNYQGAVDTHDTLFGVPSTVNVVPNASIANTPLVADDPWAFATAPITSDHMPYTMDQNFTFPAGYGGVSSLTSVITVGHLEVGTILNFNAETMIMSPVPAPSGIAMMLGGLPLLITAGGWLRRRRALRRPVADLPQTS